MSETWKRFIQVQGILAMCCTLCIVLLGIRMRLSGHMTFSFMVWNLFLACMPMVFAIFIRYFRFRFKVVKLALFGLWLLFFPNATYMISDLLHLTHLRATTVPNWYDAIMLFAFAMTGLFLGVVSLRYVHSYLRSRYSERWSWIVVGITIVLSGFGVYLGRFLRWNSWDILDDPFGIFSDIAERIIHPVSHVQTYFVTIVFTAILFFAYLLFNALREKEV